MTDRRGFTMVEVMISLTLLTIVMLGLGKFMVSFLRNSGRANALNVAAAVAQERVNLIEADPRYTAVNSLYGTGATADTTGFPGFPRMRRRTTIARDQTGSPARDFTTITVRVTDPSMKDTVSLTSVRAKP